MYQNQSILRVFIVFFLLLSPAKPEDQRIIQALVVFMNKLVPGPMQNIPGWGWNTSSDPCTSKWVGLTCDKDNIRVTKIVIDKLNLSGTLEFESVCKVSNLLVLSVNFNNITENIQQEISNCKRLTHLYLTGNKFLGHLPDSITDLPNVKRMFLSNNGFTGQLPDFSRTTGMLSFFAQNNRFTGQLPRFNYHQLDGFSVANSNFSGPMTRAILMQVALRVTLSYVGRSWHIHFSFSSKEYRVSGSVNTRLT
ncbi:hypothetical protein L1987_30631 [Smallanthus sonchifolius]|uniref:Uncharacterized protein n=1 Tax=Smallanthus sonchifolius TaxID=185202 RepID=A0ACB9I469_9ASTR|nr:hypothetical protein L1987_30631 [Smallanthus sonchifolius]